MLPLSLKLPANEPLRVLCLGAHCDDIEIGCGGILLRLLREHPNAEFTWRVFAANETRRAETEACAKQLLGKAKVNLRAFDFRDGFLPYSGYQVKEAFEALKQEVQPHLILTHTRHDLHQDHRLVCELTWNTFRNHFILEYEIPKYDGDMGAPNFFVPLETDQAEAKIDALMSCYATQRGRGWFTADIFRSLLRLRGMECNAPSGFAEAFFSRKTVI